MSLPSRTQEWLRARLIEVQSLLEEMGPDFSGSVAAAERLCHRLDEGRFRLAVVGQFKRGKSTLLNALLHEHLLPTGILPLTAIPTTIRAGVKRHVRLIFRNGSTQDFDGSFEDLQQVLNCHVTEKENPANRVGVLQVEVDHPAAILAHGVEIIDTPGIGSTLLHNTLTARETLPVCDGAVFMLSPDPPITAIEVEFLKSVRDVAARVILVVSKADTLDPSQGQELLTFLRDTIRDETGLPSREPIFFVSARQALDGHERGDPALLSASGVATLESFLVEFCLAAKQAALQEAIADKACRIIREVLFTLDIRQKAIDLPRQDLERRLERFEVHLEKLQLERMYFRDRLAGDRNRLLAELDRLVEVLSEPAREALSTRMENIRKQAQPLETSTELKYRIEASLTEEIVQLFSRAGKDIGAAVAGRFQAIQIAHCREMETLIDRVRRTAADLFEVLYLEQAPLEHLDSIKEPRIIGQYVVTSFVEQIEIWLTRLLPRRWRTKRFQRHVHATIDYLVARNVEELRWTMRQNLDQTFRSFQARMETQLDIVIDNIRGALGGVLDRQARQEATEMPKLQSLEGVRHRLEELLAALVRPGNPTSYRGPI